MNDKVHAHNEAAARLIRELVASVGNDKAALNVLAESLLVGVGMLNYPGNALRQARIIQEIADGALGRVHSLQRKEEERMSGVNPVVGRKASP